MTQTTQEKLAKIREILEFYCNNKHVNVPNPALFVKKAPVIDEGWTAFDDNCGYEIICIVENGRKAKEALTLLTELQEELKPKEIDVEKVAGVIDIFQDEVSWQPHESRTQLVVGIRDKVIAEIERQRK